MVRYLGIEKTKNVYTFREVYGAESLATAICYFFDKGYKKIRAIPGELVFEKDGKTVVIWAYDYN